MGYYYYPFHMDQLTRAKRVHTHDLTWVYIYTVSDVQKWKPFPCHRFMRACGSMALFSSLPHDQCGSLRTFPCELLRGMPKTASRREESEIIQIIHRQQTASIIPLRYFSISVSSRVPAWQPNRNSRGK